MGVGGDFVGINLGAHARGDLGFSEFRFMLQLPPNSDFVWELKCDLCDQCEKYIEEAKTNLKDFKNIGHLIAKGLQELEFAEKYDCIWIQWVYLNLWLFRSENLPLSLNLLLQVNFVF